MKRNWYLMLVLSISGILIVGIAVARKHLWTQTNNVRVLFNGEEASNSKVYKSVDGDLMVWVAKGDEKLGVYFILFKDKRVGKPYPNELLAALPWSYLIRNYPMENIIDMGTEKSYPYATITFNEHQVIFSPENNKTYEIDF